MSFSHGLSYRAGWLLGGIAILAATLAWTQAAAFAQQASDELPGPTAEVAPPEAAAGEDATAAEVPAADSESVSQPRVDEGINLLRLFISGGWFMLPIVLMSLLVATFVVERLVALRRNRILPPALVRELGQLARDEGSFDPRQAYRACQRHPSSASNVIRAMLLKVGRPHSEVEHAVAEASEREADRIYSNVRWLNLAAAVTPLMGLLGTVWGMIRAFHDTTQLAAGQNKAEFLAGGIYEALVTTLGGLLVAIPAAIFAHLFEARITRWFHEIDELLFSLLPQIEQYEGKVRFSHRLGAEPLDGVGSDGDAERPVTTLK